MYLLVSIQLILLRKLSCGRDIALGKEAEGGSCGLSGADVGRSSPSEQW